MTKVRARVGGKNRLQTSGRLSRVLLLAGFATLLFRADAEVRLPNVFSDHMVVQQGRPINVWGWAAPGEVVSVQLNDQRAVATANDRGEWKAVLPRMNSGGSFELVVSGTNVVRFGDVLIGEVWLCSGQSNMEMSVGRCAEGEKEIAAAEHPAIRLLTVPNRWSPLPQTNLESGWRVCSPKSIAAANFSACAYFFGRKLHQELGVPIGLIDATWGGTCIQSWTPPEGFAVVTSLKEEHEKVLLADPRTPEHQQRLADFLRRNEEWLLETRRAMTNRAIAPTMPAFPEELLPPHELQNATALFNGMIHPLGPFTMAGVIWYQGENNLNDGSKYGDRMKALIQGWRRVWGQGDFPFNFVQIAPYNYGGRPEAEPELWEAQASALSLPNTGMAVINDLGDLRDIHPKHKREVGERLARIALAKTYGRNNLDFSGPTFRALKVEGDKLRVTFDHADGLASHDGEALTWFEVIDADRGGFLKAKAKIEGNSVVLSSAESPHPVAMRFAWSMLAEPNLVNGTGLPASAFRAGDVPNRDSLEMTIPESSDYELVYDLDLSKVGRKITYNQDRSAHIMKPFDRIAYFLELQPNNGQPQFVYVSMKAFTTDAKKIGVPTPESGARFQQNVEDMNVFTYVAGVVTGRRLSGGNIEFWPGNYGPDNSAHVPGASSQALDFGDSPGPDTDGYGSMQIHNHDERQTILAINHWREGENADLGIGNNSSGSPDWTFARNARTYAFKRLRVLVRVAGASF